MKLTELLLDAGVAPLALHGDADATSMTMDSRRATAGGLFVCYPGMTHDSHGFIADAAERGAVAVIASSPEGFDRAVALGLAVALLPAMGFNDLIWRVCDAFFEHPTRSMRVVGITGTNGKTTVAWLVRDLLTSFGVSCAYLGTLGFKIPDGEHRELPNTTPYAVDLYNLLAEARDRGVQALSMEVSSHALQERRVEGVEFDVGVFTNLSQDHLDFHGTMEEYARAKRRLFDELPGQSTKPFTAVIHVGDPTGAEWAEGIEAQGVPVLRYALDAEVPGGLSGHAESVELGRIALLVRDANGHEERVVANLGGSYNVENLLTCVAVATGLGYSLGEISGAAEALRPVPGRFQTVSNSEGVGVIVDYAHTPDAITKLLEAVRPLTKGRIVVVFGCGGDRDRTKRPLMAGAASALADVTVVTSDNPRTEDPQAILDEVMTGILPGRHAVAILDRREAIAEAVRMANVGDVVVIAGKGHENYQIIGREKLPMDDVELARSALAAR